MDFLISYRIKSELADEQEAANRRLVEDLKEHRYVDIRYQMFRAVNDSDPHYVKVSEHEGVLFFQFQWIADKAALERLRQEPFFQEYRRGLHARCVAPPTNTKLNVTASSVGWRN